MVSSTTKFTAISTTQKPSITLIYCGVDVISAMHWWRYMCVALFSLASLAGVLLEVFGVASRGGVIGLTGLGCLSLLYAAVQLIRETLLSLDIIERHLLPGAHND
jgi:hypothetical protein